MRSDVGHIVHRMTWDITTNSFNDATKLQSDLSRFQPALSDCIEKVFNSVCPTDRWFQVEKLEVDLGNISASFDFKEFENLFKAKLYDVLKSEYTTDTSIEFMNFGQWHDDGIKEEKTAIDSLPRPLNDRAFELISYYLEHGFLPWWYSTDKAFDLNESFEQMLDKLSQRNLSQLFSLLMKPVVRRRASRQLDYRHMVRLFEMIGQDRSGTELESGKNVSASQTPLFHEERELLACYLHYAGSFILSITRESQQAKVWTAWIWEEIAKVWSVNTDLNQKVRVSIIALFWRIVDYAETPKKGKNMGTRNVPKKSKLLSLSSLGSSFSEYVRKASLYKLMSEGGAIQSDLSWTKEQIERIDQHFKEIISSLTWSDRSLAISDFNKEIGQDDRVFDQKKQETEKNIRKEELSEAIVIPCLNAGLVLLWPYLGSFFRKMNWVEDKTFVSTAAQEQAMLALHYLATGQQEAEEHELVIGKLLVGMGLDDTLDMEAELSDDLKAEGQELLNSVLTNWSALKGTSVQGLQEAFLRRPGFIELRNGQFVIRIERTGVDVLIDRIGYGLEMIVLPWREDILRCEW